MFNKRFSPTKPKFNNMKQMSQRRRPRPKKKKTFLYLAILLALGGVAFKFKEEIKKFFKPKLTDKTNG